MCCECLLAWQLSLSRSDHLLSYLVVVGLNCNYDHSVMVVSANKQLVFVVVVAELNLHYVVALCRKSHKSRSIHKIHYLPGTHKQEVSLAFE